jgi:hypothetical protein
MTNIRYTGPGPHIHTTLSGRGVRFHLPRLTEPMLYAIAIASGDATADRLLWPKDFYPKRYARKLAKACSALAHAGVFRRTGEGDGYYQITQEFRWLFPHLIDWCVFRYRRPVHLDLGPSAPVALRVRFEPAGTPP